MLQFLINTVLINGPNRSFVQSDQLYIDHSGFWYKIELFFLQICITVANIPKKVFIKYFPIFFIVYAFIYSRLHYIRTTYPCYCPLTEGQAALHCAYLLHFFLWLQDWTFFFSKIQNEFCIFVAFLSPFTRLNLFFSKIHH